MIFDIVFICLFVIALIWGFRKGFILQIATLAALALGIWGAIKFTDFIVELILSKTNFRSDYLQVIVFAIILICIIVLVILLAKLLEKIVSTVGLGIFNRLLGSLFGLIKMALLLSVFLSILNKLNQEKDFLPKEKIKESKIYSPLEKLAVYIFPYVKFDVDFSEKKENKQTQSNSK